MLDWLQGKETASEPELVEIANSVNGYIRAGSMHEGAEDWFKSYVRKIRNGEIPNFKTQELLDFLFIIHRADRFCEGMLQSHENKVATLFDTLKERIESSKNEKQSQENLLNQPVFIPFRAKKDPREIRVLDPACGSGHFLLYAFDLLETIYSEAWDREFIKEEPASNDREHFRPLRETFRSKEDMIREVPGVAPIKTDTVSG